MLDTPDTVIAFLTTHFVSTSLLNRVWYVYTYKELKTLFVIVTCEKTLPDFWIISTNVESTQVETKI